MNRRGLVGVLAVVLALVGGLLIYAYVLGADARAMANQQPTSVLVVKREIPAGTTTTSLGAYVEARQIPRAAVVPGAVLKLDDLPTANVASTTLKPGEQLLASRFVPPGSVDVAVPVPVPEGLQLVSVQVEPQRGAGSNLRPGDKVGLFLSMKVQPYDPVTGQNKGPEISETKLIANDVLVIRVQGSAAKKDQNTPTGNQGDALPGSAIMVTVAVDATLGSKLVFGAEYGKLWLSQQTPTTRTDGNIVITAENVYQP